MPKISAPNLAAFINVVFWFFFLVAHPVFCEQGIYIQSLRDYELELSTSRSHSRHNIVPRGSERDGHQVVYFDSYSEPELSYVDSVDVAVNDNRMDGPTFDIFGNYFKKEPLRAELPPRIKDPPMSRVRYLGGGPASLLEDAQGAREALFLASLHQSMKDKVHNNPLFNVFKKVSGRFPSSRFGGDPPVTHLQDISHIPAVVRKRPYFRSEMYRYMKPKKREESTSHGQSQQSFKKILSYFNVGREAGHPKRDVFKRSTSNSTSKPALKSKGQNKI